MVTMRPFINATVTRQPICTEGDDLRTTMATQVHTRPHPVNVIYTCPQIGCGPSCTEKTVVARKCSIWNLLNLSPGPVKIKLPFPQAWQRGKMLFSPFILLTRGCGHRSFNSLTQECYHAITKYPQAVSEASCVSWLMHIAVSRERRHLRSFCRRIRPATCVHKITVSFSRSPELMRPGIGWNASHTVGDLA